MANLLAVTEAAAITSRVLSGFVHDDVSHLLGVGSPELTQLSSLHQPPDPARADVLWDAATAVPDDRWLNPR